MKVYDVLVESEKKVDEGPIRFLKRTLGKNTAMGKAAQLDVELDKEVDSLFKDYYAVSKQDPNNKGMNIKSLANFLAGKGFAANAGQVISYYDKNPTFSKKAAKAGAAGAAAAAAGGKKVAGAAKKGAAAVTKAAKAVKNKVKPEPTGMTPDPRQGELDLRNSIYGEAFEAYNAVMELKKTGVTQPLDKKEVKIIIKKFVQQGFAKQLDKRVGKSAYGDAEPRADAKAGAKPAAKAQAKNLPDLKKVRADANALGYELTKQ